MRHERTVILCKGVIFLELSGLLVATGLWRQTAFAGSLLGVANEAQPGVIDMGNHTHQTAPTQFVDARGIRFAYRRFGKKQSTPLVFNIHILGNLDSWDPAITDGLAQGREVILFNNVGGRQL